MSDNNIKKKGKESDNAGVINQTDTDDWLDDATGSQQSAAAAAKTATEIATTTTKPTVKTASRAKSDVDSLASVADPIESSEREEDLHRQRHKDRHRHHHHCHQKYLQKHHHHNHGHIKELIKPDPTVRQKRARIIRTMSTGQSPPKSSPIRSPPLVADSSKIIKSTDASADPNAHNNTISAAFRTPPSSRVAVVVDEQQLRERFRESMSERRGSRANANEGPEATDDKKQQDRRERRKNKKKRKDSKVVAQSSNSVARQQSLSASSSSSSASSSKSDSSHSHSSSHDADDEIDGMRSPPPAAIIIPPNVAKSLSNRAVPARRDPHPSGGGGQSQAASTLRQSLPAEAASAAAAAPTAITREQLQYGPLLKPGEVQILYRSPETDSTSLDRHLKEEQAKLVAPNMRQSPIAIMTMNPTYELQNKPLIIEYPARVENLKLNNTGFSWEVKIPYQITMTTALYGAHLNQNHRYRLDQFHCHWGSDNNKGSEHTVDNNHYSAELHFVHYNMEKYHTMPKAARHPDGLVVLSVFLEASDNHHNHAELEKIVSHLKNVNLKGEHSIIRQAVHIENLLPQNRSYWSYQGSLTTPPYFESVTWFIFKHPIRCNSSQIQRFRCLRSSLRASDNGPRIETNHRKTQPLNGRSIVNYDEQYSGSSGGASSGSGATNSVLRATTSRSNSSHLHSQSKSQSH